jgi:hypothetical protein
MERSIRTCLSLPELLHRRLKAAAVRLNTTVSALVAEGADYILSRHEGGAQRAELASRAAEARRRLREGIYGGAAVSDRADELAYGVRKESRPSRGRGKAARR